MLEGGPVLVGDESAELHEYRSLSRLAVVSMVFGIASMIAFMHPIAWILPLVGIVIGIVAVWMTSQPETPLDGRSAALCGLCLSIFFLSAAAGLWTLHRTLLIRHSRAFAEEFIELVRDDHLERALESTKSFNYRLRTAIAEHYSRDQKAQEELYEFRNRDAIKALVEAPSDAEVSFVQFEGIEQVDFTRRCWLRYSVETSDQSTPFLIAVVCDRNPEYDETHWFIYRVELFDEEAAEAT